MLWKNSWNPSGIPTLWFGAGSAPQKHPAKSVAVGTIELTLWTASSRGPRQTHEDSRTHLVRPGRGRQRRADSLISTCLISPWAEAACSHCPCEARRRYKSDLRANRVLHRFTAQSQSGTRISPAWHAAERTAGHRPRVGVNARQ